MEKENLKICVLKDEYIEYLRKFDEKVSKNKKETRPYVGVIIEIDGQKYFSPLSSPKEKHKKMKTSLDFLKIDKGILGGLNLNNSIPCPSSALRILDIDTLKNSPEEKNRKYGILCDKQIQWINDNNLFIKEKFKKLYKFFTENRLPENMLKRCCDFKLLEEKALNWEEKKEENNKINIFSEYQIKNLKIKNRIVLPPMVRFSLIDTSGYVNDELVNWYGDIAKSGVGLIIVEASAVEESGKLRDNQIGIWDDTCIEGLSKIANEIHKYNVPCLIQIHHAGFKEKIAEVSEEELDRILKLFEDAFVRAKKCGFDGIEIHGAHTYLISQLNSKIWNTRKDKYGEHLYFSRKLIENTKYLFDDNFILGYRMGGNEPELEDGIENAKKLQSYGVDLLHVSNGVPKEEYKRKEKIKYFPKDFPLDWIVYLGTEIKKHVDIPVISVSKIKTEAQASYLVENNLSDFVAVGRAMLFRDSWMEKARKDFNARKKFKYVVESKN